MSGAAFFVPDGEGFVASEHTRGPWSNLHQHGGPPSALLGRALEQAAAALGEVVPARFWIEFLRPVPIGRLTLRVEVVRDGRAAKQLRGALFDGADEVCRAQALFLRKAALGFAPVALPGEVPALPAEEAAFEFPFFQHPVGYHTAMEIRIARGRWGEGPLFAWMRMRLPLVPGETPSALERVLCAADSGHGVAPPLAIDRYTFINPDLAVHLARPCEGEWVGLDAAAAASPLGIGQGLSILYDLGGPLGQAVQTLLVQPR